MLALVAEEELEDFVQLDELSRTLAERATPAPVSVAAGVDDVLEQDLSAAYSFDLQVLRIAPLALVDTTMPVPVLPLEASLPSPPARLDLGTEFIDLKEGTEVVLGNATGGVNELHVSLYNGLDVPLTDSRAASHRACAFATPIPESCCRKSCSNGCRSPARRLRAWPAWPGSGWFPN
ncbi:hypothetical protein [Rhodothermus marinus]|uniref:hypothetical protein n=1 Tax=Rhodothermus marinus TaxID=29549 RepID=UPI000B2F450A|nr:hypothetical protein [Rhodothermus marinus]